MCGDEVFIDLVKAQFRGDGGYHNHGEMTWTHYDEDWYLVEFRYADNGGGSGMIKLCALHLNDKVFAAYKRGPISKEIILIEQHPMAVAAILAF